MKAITRTDEIGNGVSRRYTVTPTGCWQWTGALSSEGYPILNIGGKRQYGHRMSYQLHVGPIPRGHEIDHLCRNRACMNPDHLEAVTSRENSMRGNHPLFAAARKQRCLRGHDLNDPNNVYVYPNGKRRCRVCAIDKQKERRQLSKP